MTIEHDFSYAEKNRPIQPVLIPVKESGEFLEYRGTEKELGVDYSFTVPSAGNREFNVPVNYRLDGASSPRWSWSLVGFLPTGIHNPASLIHDYLYGKKGEIRDSKGYFYKVSRKEADLIFKAYLVACGVKSIRVDLSYAAVRVGGWFKWNDIL